MGPSQEQVVAIEEWLRSAFPGHEVASGDLPARDVVLFRTHRQEPRSPRYELEISYEAFEDNPIETILGDLGSQRTADRLRSHPERRLMFDRFRQLRDAPQTGWSYRPDFALYSPDGELEMVGEVKKAQEASPGAASRIRRNLLAHRAIPNAPYFLIFFPDRLYLWKDVQSDVDSPPSRSAGIADVLRDYLGDPAKNPVGLGEESLELALGSWFRDLATATRAPSETSEADKLLVESGLYSALRRGSIAGSRTR